MTLRSRTHHRPLRTALVTSATALLVAFGGSAAFADDDDHDRRDRRGRYSRDHRDHGRDHYRGDHDRDRRSDHDRWDRDRGRGYRDGRYSDRRYRAPHRYPGRDRRYNYRDDHRGYRDHRDYRYDRGRYDHRRFNVPRHLYRRHYDDYRSYYRGSVFYGPHRHHHRVYYFPVYIDGFVQYQPHAYCGDAFYPDHYGYDGVRGHFGLHFNF